MHTPTAARGTPSWPQRVLLGSVVAGAHLWLLAGEWPRMSQESLPPSRPVLADSASLSGAAAAGTSSPAGAGPSASVRPVTVSSVRWVIPPTAENMPAAPTSRLAQRPPRHATPASAPASQPPAPNAAEPDSGPEPAPWPVAPVEPSSLAQATPTAEPATTPAASAPPEAPVNPPASADAAALPPAIAPASATLVYDVVGSVRGIAYSAQATLDWTLDAGRYDARMAVRLPLVGSRVQSSAGQVGPAGLLPERFADKARSERAAHFDHARQRIRFSANTPDAELQAGAQDRLSVFLQLAARLNAAPERIQAGQLIELQVAGTSDAEPWRFRVGEEETLNLPAGTLRTRQLVREPREPRDSQVSLWLAPALQHLPVRIRIVQHQGDQLDQQLSRMP